MVYRIGLALSALVPIVFLLSACGSSEPAATRFSTSTPENVPSRVADQSQTPASLPTPALTLEPSPTPVLQPVASPTPVPVATPTLQLAVTGVATPSPTHTRGPTPTGTRTPTPVPSLTATLGPTSTPVRTPAAASQTGNETNFPLTLPEGFQRELYRKINRPRFSRGLSLFAVPYVLSGNAIHFPS